MADVLTPTARDRIARVFRRARKRWPRARWGNLRRPSPFSDHHADRGTPIDQAYFAQFVDKNRDAISGTVLQAGSGVWSGSVRRDVVRRLEVIDLDPRNARATIVADLCDATLGEEVFDCEIAFHALASSRSPSVALQNLWTALRPGGTLLISSPVLSRLDKTVDQDDAPWRWSPSTLRLFLTDALPDANVTVESFGSVASAIGVLHGLAAEEVGTRVLAWQDDRFPVVACARVVRRATDAPSTLSG
jgi:SAM-dependent methyltransferase